MKNVKSLSNFSNVSIQKGEMKKIVGGIAYCRVRHEVFICPDLL
jgi:hypothetical protein